jgi:hypothetical protein
MIRIAVFTAKIGGFGGKIPSGDQFQHVCHKEKGVSQ